MEKKERIVKIISMVIAIPLSFLGWIHLFGWKSTGVLWTMFFFLSLWGLLSIIYNIIMFVIELIENV